MSTLQIAGEVMKTLERANDLVAQLAAENTKLRQDAAKLSDDLDEQKTIAGNWKFRAATALTRLAELVKQEPYAYEFGNSLWHASNPRITDAERLGKPLFAAAAAPPELEALQAEIERLNGVDADARTSAIDFRNKRKALEAERDQNGYRGAWGVD